MLTKSAAHSVEAVPTRSGGAGGRAISQRVFMGGLPRSCQTLLEFRQTHAISSGRNIASDHL
eukprot:2097355-Pleurochrysis_carterae.AAC.2